MPIGRPKSDDAPLKYQEAYELYQLTQPKSAPSANAIEEVATFLEWAIRDGQPGFAEGDIITIGALAQGLGNSRNTAAKGVEQLVVKGMVLRGKLKSPYHIVSKTPIFKDSSLVADEKISLTLKMESESHFGKVHTFLLQDSHDPFPAFLTRELAASRDPLIGEARTSYWQTGEIQLFQRLRSVHQDDKRIGCLLEMTFLKLDHDLAAEFRDKVNQLHNQGVHLISLYPILEYCGIKDLRAGRTQISVADTPDFLGSELRNFIDERQVDIEFFTSPRSMLKWTYALFQPDIAPMVSFSVCFVRSDLLGIFIRKMDVEMNQP